MFEFLKTANKKTIQVQIDYFERALKESRSQDAYYPERSVFPGEPGSEEAVRRPSEESIGKAREWIALQRKDYSDSKEILALCKRWEELFDAYQEKMRSERAVIQAQGAEARERMKTGNGKVSPGGVPNHDGGEGRYGYRVDTGWKKKGAPASKAETGTPAVASGPGLVAPADAKRAETVVVPSVERSSDSVSAFNAAHMTEYASDLDAIASSLASVPAAGAAGAPENASALRTLASALEAARKNPTEANVMALQNATKEILKNAQFTQGRNEGRPDGLFGPITMANLRQAAVISSSAKPSETAAPASSAAPVLASAPSAKAASDTGAFRMKDGTPMKLKDGTPVVGVRFEQGKVWVIGKNGQRVEMAAFEGPAGSLKTPEALNENARKLESLADDAFVLISALADHAVANKWKSAPDFAKAVPNFERLLRSLDVSNYPQAKAAIVAHVHGILGEGELKKEFQEVFNVQDNDAERRKKVYDYVRGSFWPNRRNAGFDGASESLSKKLAAKELSRLDATPAQIAKFVEGLVDTDFRNKPSAEIAKIIMSAKGQSGFPGFLASTFKTEKTVASFVDDVREANEELEKAYESKEAKKIFDSMVKPDGKPLTQQEIAAHKVESRKAKLAEMTSVKALSAYVRANPAQRQENFDLDTFADIEGAATFDMSDRTKKYVRNELWKDLAIEAAAIGVGAVTAGWGAVTVNALAAARWGNRVHEMMAVRVAAGTIGWGAGFEAGHGGIRSLVATARNDWTPTSAYSWESLAQSVAFWGAFSVAWEVLRKSGIVFDATRKIGEQKAVLATIVGTDVTVALGASYGISSWTGEKWTVQEALQAALMAAAFRGAMMGAEKVKFKARRDPQDGTIVLVPDAPAPAPTPAATAIDDAALAIARGKASPMRGVKYRIGADEYEYVGTNARNHYQFKNSATGEIISRADFARRARAAGVEAAPATAPAAPAAAPAEAVVPNVTDAGFKRFSEDLVARLQRVGDKVEADGYSIVRRADGYEVRIGDKTLHIDTPELVVREIMEKVAQPHARTEFLMKFAADGLKDRFAVLHHQNLGDDFRLTFENGAFGFEKKAGNGWQKVSAGEVPQNVQTKASEAVFWPQGVARAEGTLARLAENPQQLASPAEKSWFVKKFWEKNWLKAMKEFEAKAAGRGDSHGHDAHGHGGGGRGMVKSFLFGEHGSTWGGSFAWGAATQLVGPVWGIVNGEGLSRFEKMWEKEAIDFVVETLLFRYVSAGRAILYTVMYNGARDN